MGVGQGSKTPVDPTLSQLVMPPGLPARPVAPPAVAPATNIGKNLTENLRNLELPKLAPDSTSVDFGDWLAVVSGGLWSCRRRWTRTLLGGPQHLSSVWVAGETNRRFGTMAKNGTEGCDDIACCGPGNGQKGSDIDPLLLICRYQPRGVHEKTSLLKDLTESRVSTSTTVEGMEKEHGPS